MSRDEGWSTAAGGKGQRLKLFGRQKHLKEIGESKQ